MALADSLIAYWSLEEASGTRVDAHGANDLTDNNTVASGTGKVGTCADFESANNESLSIADNTDLSAGDIDFTFAGWVNFESFGSVPGIFGKDNGGAGQREYGLYAYTSGTNRLHWFVSENGVNERASVEITGLATATWYFFVVGHDSVNNQTFISVDDGTPVTASWSSGVLDGTGAFSIGNVTGSGLPMDGLIDEFGFWKRVLSSAEITELYNAGAGRDYAYITGGGGGAVIPALDQGMLIGGLSTLCGGLA